MSDQSPPSERDQLDWLMDEVDRLRVKLAATETTRDVLGSEVTALRAELEQEREARHAAESLNAGRVVEARENWSARVDALEAELDLARKAAEAEAQLANEYHAELEQARGTCPHSNCDARRWRDALERIAAFKLNNALTKIARDALAGEGQA